jgi:hypothetical protein
LNGGSHSNNNDGANQESRREESNDTKLDFPFLPLINLTGYRPQTFSILDVFRGNHYSWNMPSASDAADGIVRRAIPSSLKFPLLSSFPPIFGTSRSTSLPVHARLSTDTGVAAWIRRMSLRSRFLDTESREEVGNHIRTWADKYVEGYESEEDDDLD